MGSHGFGIANSDFRGDPRQSEWFWRILDRLSTIWIHRSTTVRYAMRRDYYQVPFDPNDSNLTNGYILKRREQESDAFATFSWRIRSIRDWC